MAPLVVLSSADADKDRARALQQHLSAFIQAGELEVWHADDIEAGTDREDARRAKYEAAALIVVLLSADYVADEHEMARVTAVLRTQRGRVLPILVRSVSLRGTELEALQMLPRSGAPVALHRDPDDAWTDIAQEIARAASAGGRSPDAARAVLGPSPGKRALVGSPEARKSWSNKRLPTRRLLLWTGALAALGLGALAVIGYSLRGKGDGRPGQCPRGMVFIAGGVELTEADAGAPPGAAVAPFCIDGTEVSVAAYERCVLEPRGEMGCAPAPRTVSWPGTYSERDVLVVSRWCNAGRAGFEDHPINCIDREMAAAYCRWANKRLPEAAEWRLAARSGDRRRYPWGDAAPAPGRINACGAECREEGESADRSGWSTMYPEPDPWKTTAPAGRVEGDNNLYGVRDMGGNVSEWIADMGTPQDHYRGANWTSARPEDVEIAHPGWIRRGARDVSIGFRCIGEPRAGQP